MVIIPDPNPYDTQPAPWPFPDGDYHVDEPGRRFIQPWFPSLPTDGTTPKLPPGQTPPIVIIPVEIS